MFQSVKDRRKPPFSKSYTKIVNFRPISKFSGGELLVFDEKKFSSVENLKKPHLPSKYCDVFTLAPYSTFADISVRDTTQENKKLRN